MAWDNPDRAGYAADAERRAREAATRPPDATVRRWGRWLAGFVALAALGTVVFVAANAPTARPEVVALDRVEVDGRRLEVAWSQEACGDLLPDATTVEETATTVTITLQIYRYPACEGRGGGPAVLTLSEPLGDREIRDGACTSDAPVVSASCTGDVDVDRDADDSAGPPGL